ncbi:uncharacterized protein LOC119285815 [Triticum dicoccoides]|uniref:uncharacterized protein LOC119285815 n=1 Tax=Triticum dicoccoides TaxID=85692 RepID=UPI00189016B5|nr:uncharacterized protein LOC119285815 [Triticum dicoccoides]XP_044363589.1 uncharacterized protein LOC123085951 [Triticum aestivum]
MTFPGGESGRWDSRQRRHSVWGCLDLVMLEHGNGKHHLSYGISNSQFTFLPQDFLHFCQYHCSWGLDFVNIKIWVLTSKREAVPMMARFLHSFTKRHMLYEMLYSHFLDCL